MHLVETNVPETLVHMFWDCPYAPKPWNIIWQYLSKTFEVGIDSAMLCTYNKEN